MDRLLSEKAVIEALQNRIGESITDCIKAIPPAEPKTGHWIKITKGAMREKYICSECGRQIEDSGIEGLLFIKYPYCHCGARMVEPQEGAIRNDKLR